MASMVHSFVFILASLMGIKGNMYTDEIMKKGCWGQICWHDETYPFEAINREKRSIDLLKKFSAMESSLGSTISSTRLCNLCSTSVNLKVEPLSIIQDDIKYYVLRNEHYNETRIELNVCAPNQESSECFNKESRNNQMYQCEQKSTRINLLVYDSLNHKFTGKSFTYPSACECTVMTYPVDL